jgi:hypothetical protein
MLGECKGMRDDDGLCVVIMGASSIVARRGDRLVVCNSLSGLMIAGSWPGVLVRVCRWCIRWVLLIKAGSVGLLLVVTLGDSFTL